MNQKDLGTMRRIMPSIAAIVRGRDDLGMAALVNDKGLFLAHTDSVYANRIKARLSDGRIVDMILVASDDPSQLAVLQAQDWIKDARPLTPTADLKAGDSLVAILPSRRIRAEFIEAKSGLLASSRHIMPLAEINFEASADTVGGALVVTQSGEMVGFLNASLKATQQADIHVPAAELTDTGPAPAMGVVGTGKGGRGTNKAMRVNGGSYGPADMTVAYTPSPAALRKTLNSFLLGKEVDHPSIGVDVKDAPKGGALIEKVTRGGTAEEAGLQAGDVVIEINGVAINKQVDLAKAVMDQQVGATLMIKAKRGRTTLILPVRVGSRQLKHHLNPGSAT